MIFSVPNLEVMLKNLQIVLILKHAFNQFLNAYNFKILEKKL